MVAPRYSLASPAVPYAALRHPFIDRFGQFAHADWPEKVHDEGEFARDLAAESAALPSAPSSWDEFGGWRDGPALEATGAFRAEKVDGRWWLVDPAGRLFFSFGVDTLRHYTDASNGNRHPDWYETTPPHNGMMTFTHWNLQRKFGKIDYLADYYRFMHRRLAGWGFNTIGRWGAWRLPAAGRTPYLLLLDSPAKAPRLPGTKIYDVFHPDFEHKFLAGVLDQAKREPAIAAAAEDPYCLGLSVDNELPFEIMTGVMMAQDFRVSPAKNAFFEGIRDKYRSLDAINAAWGTRLATWPELVSLPMPLPGAGFAADAETFVLDWLRRYFKAARNAVKSLAPKRLYFSAAFAGMEQPTAAWDAAPTSMSATPRLCGRFARGARRRSPFSSAPLPSAAWTAACSPPAPCASRTSRRAQRHCAPSFAAQSPIPWS